MSRNYKALSLFAGIGGICDGFAQTGKFSIPYANEIDEPACKTYRFNHKNTDLIEGDICKLHADSLDSDIDAVIGGFPCQPFSNAGKELGFNDPKGRGLMFFQIMRLVDELKALDNEPEMLFFENVSRLQTLENGNTLGRIEKEIESRGYHLVKPFVVNSMDYGGVPQTRKRLYLVAFKDRRSTDSFQIPSPIPMRTLRTILNLDEEKPFQYYYGYHRTKHFDIFEREITEYYAVYQYRRYYIRKNKNGVCPTLTANMGTGGHNVPLIRDYHGIRQLTEYECLDLQGFELRGDYKFDFPKDVSLCNRYKQIGNSVTVPVINRIAKEMLNALEH